MLKSRIEKLINDELLRNQLGQKGREKYLKYYTRKIFEENMYRVMHKIATFDGT